MIYTFAVIFASWGIVYHYAVWLNKPPTRRFFDRTFHLIGTLGPGKALTLIAKTAATHVVGQTFILKRSQTRWWMHQFLFWGCITAVAITFPLVFAGFTSPLRPAIR